MVYDNNNKYQTLPVVLPAPSSGPQDESQSDVRPSSLMLLLCHDPVDVYCIML